MRYRAVIPCLAFSLLVSSAHAGTITAFFDDPGGIRLVHFDAAFTTGFPGGAVAAIIPATRTDVPGPGIDAIIPHEFRVFCVELGQDIPVFTTLTFADVILLSSHPITNPGNNTGPVVFNEPRATNLEKLFGNFYPANDTDPVLNDAFQLALWEMAFDDDLSLVQNVSDPNDRLWVDPGNSDPAVTTLAQSYLDAVRNDALNLLPTTDVALLTDPLIQDQLALIPVSVGNPGSPEPATLCLLATGTLAFLRRRAR